MPTIAQISLTYTNDSGNEPDVSIMKDGELALNRADGILYFKDSSDNLQGFYSWEKLQVELLDFLIDDADTSEETTWSSDKIQDELNDKSDVGHAHIIDDVDDLQNTLDSKAEINDGDTNSNETWSSQQITDHVATETAIGSVSLLFETRQTEINNLTHARQQGYQISGNTTGDFSGGRNYNNHMLVRSPLTMQVSFFVIYSNIDVLFNLVNTPGGRYVYTLRFWQHDNPYHRWDWGRNGSSAQREEIYPGAETSPWGIPTSLPSGVTYQERTLVEDLRNITVGGSASEIRTPAFVLDTSSDPVIFDSNKVVMARFRIYHLDENDDIQTVNVANNEHSIKAYGRFTV